MLFSNMMDFFLPMKIPSVTHQEKKIAVRNGKPVVYEDERLRDARQKFLAYLAPHAPKKPMKGAVYLNTAWYYQESGRHPAGTYKTTKPDTDNLVKLFKDCMTAAGFWKDDAQVAVELTEKTYWKFPGVHVSVGEIAEAANDGGQEEADTGSN